MKRLLSLLLVIAMLFGVCTMFTACDSSSSVSDKDDDDDKKKDDEKNDDEDEVEPTLVFKGLKIVLPEDFELDNKDDYHEDGGFVRFTSDVYTVDITCGPMGAETDGMTASELRDYYLEMMDPENEDAEVREYDTGKKNGTQYLYAIKDDNTAAAVMAFYVDDDYYWMVGLLFESDEEEAYDLDEMIKLVTGWKCEKPAPEAAGPQPGPNNGENNNNQQEATRPPQSDTPSDRVSVEETVIYDDNDIIVSVTDVQVDSYYFKFILNVENNTNQDVQVGGEGYVINGTSTIYGSMYCTADAGESMDGELYFLINRLDDVGADTIGTLEFTLTIMDEDYNYIDEGTRVSFSTSHVGYTHFTDDSGDEIFDAAGIRVVVQDIQVEDADNAYIRVYVENTSYEPLSVNLEDIVINGWALPYATGYCTVMPGTNAIEEVDISEVATLGITDADEIQNMIYSIDFYNSESYQTVYEEAGLYYYPGDPNFVQDVSVEGLSLYNNNGVELLLMQVSDASGGVEVMLYLYNNTDRYLTMVIDDVMINGNDTYNSLYIPLPSGVQTMDSIRLWFDESIGFDSLEDLQSLEFIFNAYDQYYDEYIYETISVALN